MFVIIVACLIIKLYRGTLVKSPVEPGLRKNKSGGKKNKKKNSQWRRFDGESAREYEERMEIDIVRDLEEAYEGAVYGRADNGRLDRGKRRSKRLAERQKRTGRHRNRQRRGRETEEARRATEDLLDRLALEGEEYQADANRPPRA